MRVAICYSGQLRTGPACISNHLKYFSGVDADFFGHIWSVNTDKRNSLETPATKIPSSVIKSYSKNLNFKLFQVEDQFDRVTRNDAGHIALYYSWLKSIHLKRQYERETGVTYDAVVKIRPDMLLNPYRRLSRELEGVTEHGQFLVELLQGAGPNKIWYDDTLWIAANHVMDRVVDWYEANLVPIHYGYFQHGLKILGIDVGHTTTAGFPYCILRKGCVGIDTDKKYQKCWRYDDDYKRSAKPFPEPVDYYDPSIVYNLS